jgi:hypothetical protein
VYPDIFKQKVETSGFVDDDGIFKEAQPAPAPPSDKLTEPDSRSRRRRRKAS